MPEEDKVKVVIAFDPQDPSRQGKTESLPPAEAHSLVATGRAQYVEEGGSKKSGAANSGTLNS